MTASALSLRSVDFVYDEGDVSFQALSGVTLEIRKGEFVALMGASGSGKSTLMNLFGLLAMPTSGSLHLMGQNVEGLSESERAVLRNRHLGFIFQHFALLPRLTVLENILLPARFCPDITLAQSKRIAAYGTRLLEWFGIPEKAQALPAELSGGQKQRVAICRSLVMSPEIILADEPTGALDSKTAAEVLAILGSLHRSGRTVIMITHDPSVAAHAQRVLEVRDGQLVGEIAKETLPTVSVPDASTPRDMPEVAQEQLSLLESAVASLSLRFKAFLFAFRSLRAHKLRSALTGLGLLIGVASIVVISGLGDIVQGVFTNLFYNNSTRRIYVYFDLEKTRDVGQTYWKGFEARTEFPRFASLFAPYAVVRPWIQSGSCVITSANKPVKARIQGMNDLQEMVDFETGTSVGRLPNELEFQRGEPVVVLGSGVPDQLFDKGFPGRARPDFPVGERLFVSQCDVLKSFTVIGVLKDRDTKFGNRDANDMLYTPTQSLLMGMGNNVRVWFLTALPKVEVDPTWVGKNISKYLTMRVGQKQIFSYYAPSEIIEKIRGFLLVIQGLTGFIGLLCIVVGGIGIMNIMIVTVTERVREIGILKSLGAQPFHIRNLILVESVTLCLLAGAGGVGAGMLANNLAAAGLVLYDAKLAGFHFVLAAAGIGIGLVVSFACGVGFGFLPAVRAAGLDPAACLREE